MINNYNYCTFNKWLQSNWLQPNSAYNPIIFSLTTTTIEKKSRPRLQGAFSFFSTLNSQKRNSVLYSFFSSLKLPYVLAPGWRERASFFLLLMFARSFDVSTLTLESRSISRGRANEKLPILIWDIQKRVSRSIVLPLRNIICRGEAKIIFQITSPRIASLMRLNRKGLFPSTERYNTLPAWNYTFLIIHFSRRFDERCDDCNRTIENMDTSKL